MVILRSRFMRQNTAQKRKYVGLMSGNTLSKILTQIKTAVDGYEISFVNSLLTKNTLVKSRH